MSGIVKTNIFFIFAEKVLIMAKQSLGSKVISSAAHQVGRDLGKTVSNQLFGDEHATPVRHIRSNTENPSYIERRRKEKKGSTWGVVIAIFFASVIAAILGV